MRRLFIALLIVAFSATAIGSTEISGLVADGLSVYPVDRNGGPPSTRPDCESIGYAHAWVETISFGTTALYCPDDPECNDPPRVRVCQNCGKKQIKYRPKPTPWEDMK